MLQGDLVSKVLDLNDLQGFIGARRAPQPQDTEAKNRKKSVRSRPSGIACFPTRNSGRAADEPWMRTSNSLVNQSATRICPSSIW